MRNTSRAPSSPDDIIDVTPLKPRWWWPALAAAITTVGLLGWWAWQGPYQSWRDRQVVEKALQALESTGKLKGTFRQLKIRNIERNPEPVRYYLLGEFFSTFTNEENTEHALLEKAEIAALTEAKRQGNGLAALALVEKERKAPGINLKEVLSEIDKIKMQAIIGSRTGDPVATYTLARMKSMGIGVDLDLHGARDLAEQAAFSLPPGLKARLMMEASSGSGTFKKGRNLNLSYLLGKSLLAERFFLLTSPCGNWEEENGRAWVTCEKTWTRSAALAGDPNSFDQFSVDLLAENSGLNTVESWLNKAPKDTLGVEGLTRLALIRVLRAGRIDTESARSITEAASQLRRVIELGDPLNDASYALLVEGSRLTAAESAPDADESGLIN